MNISDMYPSRFLKGSDLKGPVTVTIAGVKAETMHNPRKGEITGWVLYCEKASKGVVLSKTLAQQISSILGEPDTDNWPGKRIILYPESVRVGPETKIGIRARAAQLTPANGKTV